MLFQLIATFMIGVLGASVSFIIYKMSGSRLPKAVIPFTAAAAMIAYSVWNEMTWATRTAAQLPKDYVVVANGEPVISPFSPWTYVYPRTDSFTVLNTKTVTPLPKNPGRVLAQLHRLARLEGAKKTSWIIDCANGQAAEIGPATTFDESGLPNNVTYAKVEAGNRLVDVACEKAGHPAPGQ